MSRVYGKDGERLHGPLTLITAGLIFEFLVAVQTRLLAERKPRRLAVVSWSILGVLIWGFVVKEIVVNPASIWWYAAGAAVGVLGATYIPIRREHDN